MVKRYDPELDAFDGLKIVEDEHGNYVKYDDYAQQQAEIELYNGLCDKWRAWYSEQKAEIEELRVELKATQDNEHRIVEANKLVLIRNAKLEKVLEAAKAMRENEYVDAEVGLELNLDKAIAAAEVSDD